MDDERQSIEFDIRHTKRQIEGLLEHIENLESIVGDNEVQIEALQDENADHRADIADDQYELSLFKERLEELEHDLRWLDPDEYEKDRELYRAQDALEARYGTDKPQSIRDYWTR